MKLNYDCIRDVLLLLESKENMEIDETFDITFNPVTLEEICGSLPNYSQADVAYTLRLLGEAEYIHTIGTEFIDASIDLCVTHLSFQGHEFLESIRDQNRWTGVKKVAGVVGDFSLKMISAAAEGLGNAALAKLKLENYLPTT